MMFMISGRATNQHGSPIVRDGVVAAIHGAGHSVVTAQPRRGSFSYVDYLVATRDSISRRVTKVRWAATRNIPVIDYSQLWQLILHDIAPSIRELPADSSERLATRAESMETAAIARRQREAARRQQDEADIERMRREAAVEAMVTRDRAIEENRVQQRQADMEVEVIQVDDTPKEPVIGKPRRRRIVTGR